MDHRKESVEFRRSTTTMKASIEIRNGRIVTPDGTVDGGRMVIRNDRIVRIDTTTPDSNTAERVIDATGRVVMPGLVDLHGDDIERHLYPRAKAATDPRLAVRMADRANLVSGVTTKFHAIAFEELPQESRTVETARAVAHAVHEAKDLSVDNRVHARCELSDESVRNVIDLFETIPIDLVSLMHHAPANGQYEDELEFARRYTDDRNCRTAAIEGLMDERRSVAAEVLKDRAARVARAASKTGAVVASHDDASTESVTEMANLGVDIAEYPVTMDAARRAKELGLTTAMGAPNVVRGGSLWGNLSAHRAIRDGLVDLLCSDYHPPSMLAAVFVESDEPLYERVARVTHNPAAVVGLTDRGRIENGARADVLVVDPDPMPTAEHVIVGGRERLRMSEGAGKSPVKRPAAVQ